MNSEEVYAIKKTWEIPAANPTDSGVAILLRFFTKYPSNLQKFYAFKDLPLDELSTNARFRSHAMRIVKVFNDSIELLGHDTAGAKLEDMWSNVASSHFKRKIEKQSYLELKEVILEVLTEVCNLNEQQTAAWNKLIDSVYEIIFKTMDTLQYAEQ